MGGGMSRSNGEQGAGQGGLDAQTPYLSEEMKQISLFQIASDEQLMTYVTQRVARPKNMKRGRGKTGKYPWKESFLLALKESGNVTVAAKVANVARKNAYDLRNMDPEFASAWDDAIDHADDMLEAAARQRAVVGTLEPVFYKGQTVGYVTKYSDQLLITMLKGRKPEIYRDKMEHSGSVTHLTLEEMEARLKEAEE